MKVIRRSPNKFWLFAGGKTFVLRLDREIQLIPRWRVVPALVFSAFGSGAALVAGATVPGVILGVLALVLAWGASR